MYNGILVVDKEQNYTSMDVVALIRGMSGQKKVGHTGTLDPGATGVLPICLGNATKLCDILTEKTKEYEAVCRLGLTTDTEDVWGKELTNTGIDGITKEAVVTAVESFLGDYDQIPPMYSAVWKDGKRLYDLARKGIEVEREPRRVHIDKIEILAVELPDVRFRVSCSKGTYIRTLCADIGKKLGVGAVMAGLRRIRSGIFDLEQAKTLAKIQEYKDAGNFGALVMPTDACFPTYPRLHVTADNGGEKNLYNGNLLAADQIREEVSEFSGRYRIYDGNDVFYGVYEKNEKDGGESIRPWKMFPPVN